MMFTMVQYGLLLAAALFTSQGAYLFARPALRILQASLRTDRRHLTRMKALRELRRKDIRRSGRWVKAAGRLHRWLELLLITTGGDKDRPGAVQSFLLLAASLFGAVGTLALFASGSVRFSLLMAVIAVFCLYMRYHMKLRKIQIQGGYDLAEAVGILTSKYKVNRGNMRSALREASQEVRSVTIRRHFIKLVREEINYTNPEELERSVEEFVYSINTSFAKQLGLALLKGLVRGEYVESTLSSIDKNIHKNIDMLRDEGDSSSEVLQLSWLHVLLFPALILFMVVFMGFSSTMHYQLGTETGRYWLTITVIFILFSLVMAFWFKRPPNDY
ncbi:hypothetical protein [Paenibacillus thalictri]|uniref:Type II secretion system protein GspF domain-containing protein n=1 Tax=Paenibacillus thalictri TaxID=2527873 RepID=A0A4Q9DXS8_9BACL|nr:hypothetical protein [Paenibacillus thalictri]TBL80608.1 hypothetical protein EYB31_05100 [Paenibacillus thalictri]